MEAQPEAVEERKLRPVANRVAIRMERCRELQADDRRDPSRQVKRQGTWLTALCTLDPMRAHAYGASDLTYAQPAMHPCGAQVRANALAQELTSLRAERCDAFAAWHAATIEAVAHPALIRP